jgi:hypothetical protein
MPFDWWAYPAALVIGIVANSMAEARFERQP